MIDINKIYKGTCLDVLKTFPDNSIDSCVTDPPYGISFMNKHWDYDVPKVEVWKEVLRVLKPGGYILCACGTRTQHRMAVNIEDAGFEIRDIVSWIYGSGFPKSLDISKAIDKQGGESLSWFIDYILNIADEKGISRKELTMLFPSKNGNPTGWLWNKQKTQGITIEQFNTIKDFLQLPFASIEEAEREVIGQGKAGLTKGTIANFAGETEFDITVPESDAAKQWEGWGTALKPAQELWTLARKPLSENTVAENVLKYGTGGINIDGSRIAHNEEQKFANRKERSAGWNMDNCGFDSENNSTASANEKGRFPANVIFDEFTGKILDEQSGITQSSDAVRNNKTADNIFATTKDYTTSGHTDIGGASRFFYTPKADNYERNKGLKGFDGKQTNDGREKDIDNAFQRGTSVRQNHHPTVKPIDLMRYLVKLITQKRGICLDPYCGSGTTLIGCKMELINYIGIEREEEYCKIAEARVAAWNPERFIEQKLF